MKVFQGDEILLWLNERKKQLVAGQPVPIDVPWGKKDDLTGGGMMFEGYPVVTIQFFDKDHSAIVSTSPDDAKCAATVRMKEGSILLWVRQGHEALCGQIEHKYRIFNITVY